MPDSFPRLCCSFAERPSKVGVAYHNAAYRALGLDYTYVAFSVLDAQSAVQALRTLGIRGCGVTITTAYSEQFPNTSAQKGTNDRPIIL